MPRQPRHRVPGYPQHVVQRGNGRRRTFIADSDFELYRQYLSAAAEKHLCQIHAYCLMTNHVHLLVTPETVDGVSKLMQTISQRYVSHFNHSYERTGTLWEGRYRATLVDRDSYVLACYRYIELNPVRAGIVSEPYTYSFSSHRANAFGESDLVVRPHGAYLALGSTAAARFAGYRKMFETEMPAPLLAEIRKGTMSGGKLGN